MYIAGYSRHIFSELRGSIVFYTHRYPKKVPCQWWRLRSEAIAEASEMMKCLPCHEKEHLSCHQYRQSFNLNVANVLKRSKECIRSFDRTENQTRQRNEESRYGKVSDTLWDSFFGLFSEVHTWEQPVDKVSRRSALLLRSALHHAAFVDFSGALGRVGMKQNSWSLFIMGSPFTSFYRAE